LIADGAIAEADAVTAGLKDAVVALAVDGVAMTNLVEVEVTFNQELAADKDVAGNFEVKVGSTVKAIEGVSKTDNVVTLTVTEGAIAQQDDVIVTVKKDAGLEEAVETTITNVLDKEVPEVASVTVAGPNKFKVTFTEPLKTTPTAEINNGAIFASVSGFAKGVKEVTVTAGATLTDGEAYTLKVTGATDFADYTMIAYAGATTYVKSADAVTVEVVSVKEEEVKIKFSAPVKAADLGTADFYHTFSAFAPTGVTPKSADAYEDEYTLDFTTYKVGYVATNLVVIDDDVVDEWGNKMAADAMLPIVAVKDEVAPTVSVVEVKDDQTTVKFSEEVKAFTTAEVTMKDADGDEVTVTGVTVDGDDATKYVIAYASQSGGAYTLEIKDVVDKSLAENKLSPSPTTLAITITDTTAPVISTATSAYSAEVVFVTFDEAMSDSVISTDAWRATTGAGLQVAPTKAEFWGTSNKEVKLTFATGTDTNNFASLVVGRVADSGGNLVADLFTDIIAGYAAASDAEILEVKTIADNKVTVKVAGKVTEGLTAANVKIDGNGTSSTAASISSSFVDDGVNTLITVTLKANLTFAAAEKPTNVALTSMKIDKGFDVTATSDVTATAKDGIAPSMTAVTSTGANTLTVTFDEAITTTQALAALDLVVTVDGTVKTAVTDYTTTIAGAVVTITLTDAPGAGKVVKVDTVATPVYLQDAAGNKANPIGDAEEVTF
jgi:hypothetical protein